MAKSAKAAPKKAELIDNVIPGLEDHIAGVKEILTANGREDHGPTYKAAKELIIKDVENRVVDTGEMTDQEILDLLDNELPVAVAPKRGVSGSKGPKKLLKR